MASYTMSESISTSLRSSIFDKDGDIHPVKTGNIEAGKTSCMVDSVDITDCTVLIHVAQTTSTTNRAPPIIIFNTSCLPEKQQKKPLSEYKRAKFTRMYDIILKTPQGPHSRTEVSFHPSFNMEQRGSRFLEEFSLDMSEIQTDPIALPESTEEMSDVLPVSSLLQKTGSKRLCSRFIDRPRREVSARKKSIREFKHVEWCEDEIFDDASSGGWGADSPTSTKESLEDLGIVVNSFQLPWEELPRYSKRPYRCYVPSALRISWSYGSVEDQRASEWGND